MVTLTYIFACLPAAQRSPFWKKHDNMVKSDELAVAPTRHKVLLEHPEQVQWSRATKRYRTCSHCYQACSQLLHTASQPLRLHLQQWEAGLLSERIAVSNATTHEGVDLSVTAQCAHGEICIVGASRLEPDEFETRITGT
jgi:hypothetical protein